MANFEYEKFSGAFVVKFAADVEHVGRLLVIVKHHVAADGADLLRILYAQAPASDIELMDALVAEIAVAVVPKPVEVVMKAIAGKGMLGRGAQPEIVMDAGGNRFDWRMADCVAPFEA